MDARVGYKEVEARGVSIEKDLEVEVEELAKFEVFILAVAYREGIAR